MRELLRASIFHTPENAFHSSGALRAFADGALVVSDGTIAACGDYAELRGRFPDAAIRDLRGSFILPGLIDTHIHFPQVRVLGGLGYSLLDWLEKLTLPEEGRLADAGYASVIASEFIHSLASHGTTTALVFGSHFADATIALFDEAERVGLRIVSGLVLSDRMLRPELHTTPERAYRECRSLIDRVKRHARLGYAVIPRFALSASEPMLEVCQALLREDPSLTFTTHMNESPREIETVRGLFPWASDYLAVYENFGLIGRRSVLAHNIHTGDSELARLTAHSATVAHCPCSNAALGSGIFPMRRHLNRGARFALGTDVGGGTGFGMMKEALQAYLLQRLAADSLSISPAHMLYLATRAGAEALAMEDSVGDFTAGKKADYVILRPFDRGSLANALRGDVDPLAALFTLGGSQDVREVRVEGDLVYESH